METNIAALRIQSTWRGKRCRKYLKRRIVAAVLIQRMTRGVFCRIKFGGNLENQQLREQSHAQLKKRLREIKNQEADLRLLQTIEPNVFITYEKARKINAARAIQRHWRRRRSGDIHIPHNETIPKDIPLSNEFVALRQHIFDHPALFQAYLPNMVEQKVEQSDPVGLMDLFNRIKTKSEIKMHEIAAQRSNGVRHKYRELLLLQQTAGVAYEEYNERRELRDRMTENRRICLSSVKQNVNFLSNLPSLDAAAKFVSDLEQIHHHVDDHQLVEDAIDRSISNHLAAIDSFSSTRWDSVYIPLVGKKSLSSSSLRQHRAVANFADTGRDDSLLWVSYGMQSSHVDMCPATSSKRGEALRKTILAETRDITRTELAIAAKLKADEFRINKLSKYVEDAVWDELRRNVDLHLKKQSRIRLRQTRLLSAVRIQAQFRGFMARRRVAFLRDQRRIAVAIHNFVREISSMNRINELSSFSRPSAICGSDREPLLASRQCAEKKPFLEDVLLKIVTPSLEKSISEQKTGLLSRKHFSSTPENVSSAHNYFLHTPSELPLKKTSFASRTPFSDNTPMINDAERRSRSTVPTVQTPIRSPVKVSTPMIRTHDSSTLLSPFPEMHTEEDSGYISPPSQNHTLSRSLSASFGQVVLTDDLSQNFSR